MGRPIPISAAKSIAAAYGYDQVIIYGRKVGADGVEHMTTYGVDAVNREVAASMGAVLKNLIDWSGAITGQFLRRIMPAVLRPAMYVGDQGERSADEWRADAVRAYVEVSHA